MGWHDALWGISWQNLAMLNASAPRYDEKGGRRGTGARLSGGDLAARMKKS